MAIFPRLSMPALLFPRVAFLASLPVLAPTASSVRRPGAGLTTGTLTLEQPLTFGRTGVASSTASLDQGVLRDPADTQGGIGGCGGTCTSTGGRMIAESAMSDNVHFTITDAANSAIVTLHAHLGGAITPEGTSGDNYNIFEQFILGGSGCWGSATGLGAQPCLSQNFGFLTSSFTNQSATGFDFTGTFQVTNGARIHLSLFLTWIAKGERTAIFQTPLRFR